MTIFKICLLQLSIKILNITAVQDLSQSLNPGRSLHLNQGQDQEPGRGPDQVKDNEAVNLLVIYNGK